MFLCDRASQKTNIKNQNKSITQNFFQIEQYFMHAKCK